MYTPRASSSSVNNSPQPKHKTGHTETEAELDAKKRKIQRACDVCRRKKIRCDGPMTSHSASKCSNCQEYGYECTYVEAAKRRGPPKGYIEALERRCARLEKVVKQLSPALDLISIVGPAPDKEDHDHVAYQNVLRNLGVPDLPAIKPIPSTDSPDTHNSPFVLGSSPWQAYEQDPRRSIDAGDDQERVARHQAMAQAMDKLEVKDSHWRFHGEASLHHLLMTFHELRLEKSGRNMLEGMSSVKRNEFWQIPEWEIAIANEGLRNVDLTVWPDDALAHALIDAYFIHTNDHFPLLNRVVFERQYRSGLHQTHHDFAKVCLMVFANAAKFVDDAGVLWPIDDATTEEGKERLRNDRYDTLKYSAGWKYLRALLKMGRSIMSGPNLFDFQCQVLMCLFLHGSAVPHLTWLVSGIGLRAAQEIGIHVRSILLQADPIERALYNRAFWCLYHIDRVNCAIIGRSVALQDSDFDADYPIAVDDEYWDTGDPDRDFVQPPGAGVPRVMAFIHTLKLDHIIGAALRTIYAFNKPSASQANRRGIVVELDSALNTWADGVPDGLRWDPTRSDRRVLIQSAALYAYYYFCQILVHRPFIPTGKVTENIGLPSLAICSNAARSISNIIDTVMRRSKEDNVPSGQVLHVQFMLPAWIAAIILLIGIYSGKQQPQDRERAIADVAKCITGMSEIEISWRQAGKATDILRELASEIHDPKNVPIQGRKRPVEETVPEPTVQTGENMFDQTLFESLYGTLDGSSSFDAGDMWSQLFGGYMQ